MTGIPLNSSREQLSFIKLFNERTRIILIEDENGGFQLVDAFSIALQILQCGRPSCGHLVNETNFSGHILADCDDQTVARDIVPAVRDEILKIILGSNSTAKEPPSSAKVNSRQKIWTDGNSSLPCVVNKDKIVQYANSGKALNVSGDSWPLDKLVECPEVLATDLRNLTAKYPLHKQRVPVPGEWPPVLDTAVVFSLARPQFTIVTPMFNVEVLLTAICYFKQYLVEVIHRDMQPGTCTPP